MKHWLLSVIVSQMGSYDVGSVADPDLHEEEPHNMEIGISVRDLLKIYDVVSSYTPTYIHVCTCMWKFTLYVHN